MQKTHLVINGVKLGEDDAINKVRIVSRWVVSKGLVELDQLVDSFVAHKGFANKEHHVWVVHFD